MDLVKLTNVEMLRQMFVSERRVVVLLHDASNTTQQASHSDEIRPAGIHCPESHWATGNSMLVLCRRRPAVFVSIDDIGNIERKEATPQVQTMPISQQPCSPGPS